MDLVAIEVASKVTWPIDDDICTHNHSPEPALSMLGVENRQVVFVDVGNDLLECCELLTFFFQCLQILLELLLSLFDKIRTLAFCVGRLDVFPIQLDVAQEPADAGQTCILFAELFPAS